MDKFSLVPKVSAQSSPTRTLQAPRHPMADAADEMMSIIFPNRKGVGIEPPRAPPSDAAAGDIGVESGASEPISSPSGAPAGAIESHDQPNAETGVVPPPSHGPKAPSAKNEVHGFTFRELLSTGEGNIAFSNYECSVNAQGASDYIKMFAQVSLELNRWAMSLPSGLKSYTSTSKLFTSIKKVLAEHTRLSEKDSALLTFWVFSTWFREVLSVSPCVVITGSPYEGEVILRALNAFSRRPTLIAGMTKANLENVEWDLKPTLLISDPNISNRMALLLSSSTSRGYLALLEDRRFEYFGAKAIYIGEDLPKKSRLQHAIHVNASASTRFQSRHALPLSKEMTQSFQNQLLSYRLGNFREVFKSDFNPPGLSPEINAIASALGRCIVHAPALQAELVSLLTPYSEQQITERLDDLGTLAVEAALSLCHQGKDRILVSEIASTVNRLLRGRGERLQYSAENIGHKLKKIGLLTRRLGGTGNGFVFDRSTQIVLHAVAATYGCVGLVEDHKNLHCPLCEGNKQLADAM